MSGFIALGLVADFSMSFLFLIAFFYPRFTFALQLAAWLLPVALWYVYTCSGIRAWREAWPGLRHALIIFYVPLFVNTCIGFVILALWRDEQSPFLVGLPVYFVGVQLLFLGYRQATLGPPPPQTRRARDRRGKESSPAAALKP